MRVKEGARARFDPPFGMLRAMLRGLAGTLSLWAMGAVVLRVAVVAPERCPPVTAASAASAVEASADWMARVQRPDGSYLYEYDAQDDAASTAYNIVRHAGVTMSLYQLAAAGDVSYLPVADRALEFMRANMVRHADWAALRDPYDGSIELGANSLLLAGLAQRRLATTDASYDVLMHEVARFVLVMQQPDGSFLNTWLASTGAPHPYDRSRYSTGEAFWALTLMHRLFPGEGWDRAARLTADYLSLHRDRVEGQKFPPWADQWAAYGLAEMADWPLNDHNIRYARDLSARFGFLARVESQRGTSRFSELFHGRQARAAGLGTWGEALDSLWRLASTDPRMADLRDKLGERAVCVAGMLANRQVTEQEATDYARPGVARGAWFTKGVTRMDDQQHALSALLRAEAIIDPQKGRPAR